MAPLGRSPAGDLPARVASAEALLAAGRHELAQAAFAALVAELGGMRASRPDDVHLEAAYARQLVNLGMSQVHQHRLDKAVDPLQRAVAVVGGLHEHDDTGSWSRFLALTLRALVGTLTEAGRWAEALPPSRRLLELHRSTFRERLDEHQLAVALRIFASARAGAGAELDEARGAVEEAVALHLTVLTREPVEAYLDQIYATELVQSRVLAAASDNEAAARVRELVGSRHLDDLPARLRRQQR